MKPARGFTLLELLVAISILAMVSMIAWRGLDSLVRTRERLGPEAEQVRALLTAFGQLERDLARVARADFFALPSAPVNVRLATQGQVLEIVRIAPGAEGQASALQTVFWRVTDGYLMRQASPPARTLGAVEDEQLSNVRLLDNVKAMRVRIWRDQAATWSEATEEAAPAPPPPGATGGAAPLLQGIELTIERNDGSTVRRVVLVG